MSEEVAFNPVEFAVDLTIAWLGNQNNRVAVEDVPAFMRLMHATVVELADVAPSHARDDESLPNTEYFIPAVSVRKSLASMDHIISMIDGKPYKTLRRHLSTNGLTPEEYRARYNLKPDYPMVAPSYSQTRREMAHQIGLGSKGRQTKATVAAKSDTTSTRKSRVKMPPKS